MRIIERHQYIRQLKAVMGTPDIKIITGIRRSGKSKLMQSFIEFLQQTDTNANIVHIDFNLPDNEHLAEYHALYGFVKESHKEGVENYLLIDEVQNCAGFEKAINGLHASELFDIYLTGSNAFLLSSDLATLFTGRTFEIKVFPFSFEEFSRYYELPDAEAAFDRYTKEGGMAGSYLYKNEKDRYAYIAEVFRTLIVRDIRQNYKIRNQVVLDRLTDFLMDNISNISSSRNITKVLGDNSLKVDDKTVGAYIKYLCQAFLFYPLRRYDIKGKRYLASSEKYYLADHAFRYAVLGTKNMDYGHVYENIVAIELMRRGYEVYAGYLYKKEIDFVAVRQNEKLYIQVSDDISGQETLERETAPLLNIKDAYPKVLIARTRHEEYQHEGIRIINLADWLLS